MGNVRVQFVTFMLEYCKYNGFFSFPVYSPVQL